MFITLGSPKRMSFIAVTHVLSLLWQLKVSTGLLKMGKVKTGLFCYLTAEFDKSFTEMFFE